MPYLHQGTPATPIPISAGQSYGIRLAEICLGNTMEWNTWSMVLFKSWQIQGKLWTWVAWAWSQCSYGSEPIVPARARHLGREVMPNPPPEQRGLRLKQSPSPTNRASGTQDQVNRESAKGVKSGTSGGSWEEHQQSLCPSLVYEPSPSL